MSELMQAHRMLPGMLLAKKYRLNRKIGQGAMGVVWAARNEATGREVALKLIARPDPSLRKRLLREAQSCGALQHPNIVDVIDVARTDSGEPCLIMELLLGESVAALLEARRRLEAPLAVRIARDVAGALAAAHAVQIVHRDLKPANLFLHRPPEASDFVVKVLDFGVAKNLAVVAGVTSTLDAMVGSPFYMSPEQVRADADIDPRADLWALGVVLFEMLTGVRPFQGEGPHLLSQILEGDIPKVSRYLRHVDERLVGIVDRCLRRHRGERFGSAEEVARELAGLGLVGAGGAGAEAGALRGAAAAAGAYVAAGASTVAEERWDWRTEEGSVGALPGQGTVEAPETVVATAHGRKASPEALATTVPLGRAEAGGAGSGGGKSAAGQGLQAAAGQGVQAAGGVGRGVGAPGFGAPAARGPVSRGPVSGAPSSSVLASGMPVSGAGASMGGVPVGGAPMGGVPVGGASMGGVPVGGASMGGVPVGGASMGGVPVGGTPMGGVPVGGGGPTRGPAGGAPVAGALSGMPAGGAPLAGAPTGVPVGGAPVAGAPAVRTAVTGAPAAGTVGTRAPVAGAPIAGAPAGSTEPVVTLRGTLVMQGKAAEAQRQAAEAQRQAAMAMRDAAVAKAPGGGARGASERSAAGVGTGAEARRRRGRASAVTVAVVLVAGVLVGLLATTWIIGWEKPPAAPAGADGGGERATGTPGAARREAERAAATGAPGAASVPAPPAGTSAPAEVGSTAREGAAAGGQGERGGAKADPGTQAPQGGAGSPEPAATARQANPPPRAGGTAATTGERKVPSGGGARAATKPSPGDSIYETPTGATVPGARGDSAAGTPAPGKKNPAPPRPF